MSGPEKCLWCGVPGADSTMPAWSRRFRDWPVHARCRPAAEAFRARYFGDPPEQMTLGKEVT